MTTISAAKTALQQWMKDERITGSPASLTVAQLGQAQQATKVPVADLIAAAEQLVLESARVTEQAGVAFAPTKEASVGAAANFGGRHNPALTAMTFRTPVSASETSMAAIHREAMKAVLNQVLADGKISFSTSYSDEYDKLRGAGQALFAISDKPQADLAWVKGVIEKLDGDPGRTHLLLDAMSRAANARVQDLALRPPATTPEAAAMRALLESVAADGKISFSTSYADEHDKINSAGQALFKATTTPHEDLRWIRAVLKELEGVPKTEVMLKAFEHAAEARAADLANRPLTMNPTREAIARLLGEVLADGKISFSTSYSDEYDKLKSTGSQLLSSSAEPHADLNWLAAVLGKLDSDPGRTSQMLDAFRRTADARAALLAG